MGGSKDGSSRRGSEKGLEFGFIRARLLDTLVDLIYGVRGRGSSVIFVFIRRYRGRELVFGEFGGGRVGWWRSVFRVGVWSYYFFVMC